MDAEDFFDSPSFFLVPPSYFRVVLFRREQLFQYPFIHHCAIMS